MKKTNSLVIAIVCFLGAFAVDHDTHDFALTLLLVFGGVVMVNHAFPNKMIPSTSQPVREKIERVEKITDIDDSMIV
jgi:hypothetical protein